MNRDLLYLTRRSLFRGLGVGAAAALAGRRSVHAAGTAIPTRVLFFYSGSGVPGHAYGIKSQAGGPPTENDFVFPEVRAPLNAIRKDLTAFENIDMVSAAVDRSAPANAHYAGETHCLAATARAQGDTAGGPSVDQFIAQKLNSPRPVTDIPSLTLSTQVDPSVGYIKICTAAANQVIVPQVNAYRVYDRLFGGFTPPSQVVTGPSPEEIAARQRTSVLDRVKDDFAMLRSRLGQIDRAKLDAHATAVRDLEQRLALTNRPPAGPACKDPTKTAVAGSGSSPATLATYRANFDAMTRMIQAAFACDRTRVALLAVSEPWGEDWGYSPGAFGTRDAHDLVHRTSVFGDLRNNTGAMALINRLHHIECNQFIKVLDLLRSTPESDGSNLLDHTIVLWCGQIAEHNHGLQYLPWILAGGSAVGFAANRYLKFDRVNGRGVAHNELLLSIAQGMGVDASTFGDPTVCRGPLPGLRKA